MSLRVVGNQLLETPASPMLAGVSVVSLSMWVRVNPGCSVANPNGVKVFGDGAGRLSVVLTGAGTLQVLWSPSGGTSTVGNSSFTQALTSGTSHHLAVSWQDGFQRYFLDGQVVATDNQLGALGTQGGTPAPFRLGSDSAGIDLTVDEPTLWSGYALSGTDVVNLRDRVEPPTAIAPGSLALAWSLAGPDGLTARAGDVGLADASPSNLSLGTIVGAAPTYVGGTLSYVAPANIGPIKVAPSGMLIIADVADPAGDPAAIVSLRSIDDIQVLSLVDAPAHGSFTLGFGGQTSTPIPVAVTAPSVSAIWTFTGLTPGTPYYVRVWWHLGSYLTTAALVEVFDVNGDGSLGPRLQEGVFDLTSAAENINDFQSLQFTGSSLVPVQRVGAYPALGAVPVSPSGPSLAIRLTGNGQITLGDVHCTPHGPDVLTSSYYGHPVYTDPNDQAAYHQNLSSAVLTGTWQYDRATGYGSGNVLSASAADIQSALLGLAGGVIPAGSVTVTGSNPYSIALGGSLGGAAQPTIVSSDPSVIITHDDTGGSTVGGQFASISVDGGPPVALSNVLWAESLPFAVYPLPAGMTIAPTSTVTFSAPPGNFSTAAGPTPTYRGIPVTNPGTILPAPSLVPKTMRFGFNIEGPTYYSPGRVYSDFGRSFTTNYPSLFPATDANGYPTKMGQPFITSQTIHPGTDFGGAGRGANTFPRGQYRILWDGACNLDILPDVGITPISANRTGGVGNEIVVDIRGPNFGASANLRLETNAARDSSGNQIANPDGTYPCDLQNLHIYPPDPSDPSGNTPWANPTKYYPTLAAQAGNLASFRTMDGLQTNFSNVVLYSDLMTPSNICYFDGTRGISVPLTRVEHYNGTDGFFNPTSTTILFTTGTPHGFVDGQGVGCSGDGTANFGTQGDFPLTALGGCARVLSPTTFACDLEGLNQPMTNVLTPTGATTYMGIGAGGIPFQDCVDIANHLACDLWLNIPALANDDCVSQMAAYVAANLNPRLRAHVELSNEIWNLSFSQCYYFSGMSNTLLKGGYAVAPFQVYRSAQVHAIFARVFAAQGIAASRLVRVIGTAPFSEATGNILAVMEKTPTYSGATATTVDLVNGVTTATTNGVATVLASYPPLGPYAFDEVATSSYVSSDLFNGNGSLRPITDALNNAQLRDILALKVASNQVRDGLAAHRGLIAASGLDPKPALVLYECNWDPLIPFVVESSSLAQTPNQGPKTQFLQYNPAMYDITLALLQQWQDGGATLGNFFYLNGDNNEAPWDTYHGFSMMAGTGTEAGASNVTDPTDIPNLRSVVGGAINLWNSLAATSAVKRVVPGRSYRPRSTGYRAW